MTPLLHVYSELETVGDTLRRLQSTPEIVFSQASLQLERRLMSIEHELKHTYSSRGRTMLLVCPWKLAEEQVHPALW